MLSRHAFVQGIGVRTGDAERYLRRRLGSDKAAGTTDRLKP